MIQIENKITGDRANVDKLEGWGEDWVQVAELPDDLSAADLTLLGAGEAAAGEINLPMLRARYWSQIKLARDAAQNGGCMTPLGRVDTDPDSQRKVSGSVQLAMIAGAQFSVAWTMQDNAVVVHDAASMIAMGVAVGQHVAACHAVAQAKRAALDAATTIEEIAAVDIEGGWPN